MYDGLQGGCQKKVNSYLKRIQFFSTYKFEIEFIDELGSSRF